MVSVCVRSGEQGHMRVDRVPPTESKRADAVDHADWKEMRLREVRNDVAEVRLGLWCDTVSWR